jgi:hypothetical protein
VWIEVDDHINAPVRRYLGEPLVIDQTGTLAATWSATLSVNAGYRGLAIQWEKHPSPDVDSYIVYIGEQPGLANPTGASAQFIVGSARAFDLFNLESGSTLFLAVGAYDEETDHLALSQEVKAKTLALDFALSTSTNAVTLATGTSTVLTLRLTSPIDPFPDTVFLYMDCGFTAVPANHRLYLPLVAGRGSGQQNRALTADPILCQPGDGFLAALSRAHVTPTPHGAPSLVTIGAVNTPPGKYIVPIIAESSSEWVWLPLEVTVTAAQTATR